MNNEQIGSSLFGLNENWNRFHEDSLLFYINNHCTESYELSLFLYSCLDFDVNMLQWGSSDSAEGIC